MDPSSLTLLLLAACVAALLLVRRRWSGLGQRTHRWIFCGSILAIAVFMLGRRSNWVTISDRLNTGVYWGAILGYLLLLTIHSLNRPRWLATLSAVLLAVPILGASLFLPLGGLFHPQPRRLQPLGDHFYASWQDFSEGGAASSGVDVEVLYRPPAMPVLQQARVAARFYNTRCHAAATEVVMQPGAKTVYVRCPPWPGASEENAGAMFPVR